MLPERAERHALPLRLALLSVGLIDVV